MSYFERKTGRYEIVNLSRQYIHIRGGRESVLHKYPKEFTRYVEDVLLETAKDCSKILGLLPPIIIIRTHTEYSEIRKKHNQIEFAMQTHGTIRKDGTSSTTSISVNPEEIEELYSAVQKSPLEGKDYEYFMRASLAHEMYHHYLKSRLPFKDSRILKSGKLASSSEEAWDEDREEYACDLFALGYIRSIPASSSMEEEAKKSNVHFFEKRVEKHRVAQRRKSA